MERKNVKRLSWDRYFLKIAKVVSERSTCLRRKVGAILVKDKQILATGYNGAPTKLKHCSVTGCLRNKLNIPSGQRPDICRGSHAEQNVLIQAALHGISTKNSTLYITHFPCFICSKMIINSGIKKIIVSKTYPDKEAVKILKQAKIKIKILKRRTV